MKQKIRISVVSDVVCPWCYIGKKRLDKAMENLSDRFDFEVSYRPFELNPDLPPSGADNQSFLARKFGGGDRYRELTSRITEVAALDGLQFDFARQTKIPNTRKLHALIRHASDKGLQGAVVEVLYNAYFISGIDLSVDANIVKAGLEAGLDESEVAMAINDEEILDSVKAAEGEVSELGVTAVPFFIINDRYGISGAQASETFEQALKEIGQAVPADDASCAIDERNR